jgi:hypothetical protein
MAILIQDGRGVWPELPYAEWKDTCETLHMYMQVIGKLRLAFSPKCNQWWNVPFYVTARGLTTSAIPYGHRSIEARFDFIDHALLVDTSEGTRCTLPLQPRTVADFYRQVLAIAGDLHLDCPMWPHPVEVPNPIPFAEDTVHHSYDPEAVHRFWTITRQLDTLFKRFRGQFRGKCSPVHFFWGSFDLAVSRFCGRMTDARQGADRITADAYDEEVSSLGFWPGNDETEGPVLYSYMVPEPSGYAETTVAPAQAFYSSSFKEFLLPYDAIRNAADPDQSVLAFAESTYLAGAVHAGWDVEGLRYTRADAEPAVAAVDADARL